ITERDVAAALERLKAHGGRLGENLVAIGAIDQEVLDGFIHRIPREPKDIAATGIEETELLALLMKVIYSFGLTNIAQFTDALKLPLPIMIDLTHLAIERQLLYTLGSRNSESPIGMTYALTDEGRRWTQEAIKRL